MAPVNDIHGLVSNVRPPLKYVHAVADRRGSSKLLFIVHMLALLVLFAI